MPSFGDYVGYQNHYSNKSTDIILASAGSGTIVPKSSSHRIYIQKITFNVTTHAAGKYLQATDGTILIAKAIDQTAAAGVPDTIVFDFGPKGRAMTLGATVTISSETAGPVADCHVEAYEKLDGVISYLAGASLQ